MTRTPRTLVWTTFALLATACTQDSPTTPVTPDDAAFAKRAAPEPPGALSLCKVAGAGIDAGYGFTFELTLAGVTRVAEVAAGSCLDLDVPLERAPSSKGYYQRKVADVNRLLPEGTGLVVDAALLSAEQVSAILAGGPGVEASSSLLLNLVQQLIAADLNVLRGAQATPEVVQAMADANAGVQIDPGPPIVLTTSLGTSELSALVNTLTAFNEGKLELPPAPALTLLGITESADALTELVSIACVPPAACSDIDLNARSVTAATSSGETTTVTFTNRAKPVLRICKVAGAGITEGTVYGFTAGGIDVTDAESADVAAGDCGDVVLLEATYMLVEDVPDGEAVQSIVCDPTDACTDISLSVGQVKVAIVRGLTTVTFTNRSTRGTLVICKVAGTGVDEGDVFHFSAGGINITDAASYDVAAGDCEENELDEGNYMTAEAVPTGIAVSAIACDPVASCTNPSLSVGQVTATVTGAETTTVTFTNRSTIGSLRICKIAGPGVSNGDMFRFNAGGINITDGANLDVAAGDCDSANLMEGRYMVTEDVPDGVAVSAVTCEPVESCDDPSLSVGVVNATVTGGATTTVRFTNRSTVAVLRICKLAGPGVTNGTVFDFSAGGINVTDAASLDVAAGSCGEVNLQEGMYMVTEFAPPGIVVDAIDCNPVAACSNPSLGVATVTASLAGATTTTITFTNSAPADALAAALRPGGAATGRASALPGAEGM